MKRSGHIVRAQRVNGRGRRRLSVALVLSVGLLVAVLAAPAGGANDDPSAVGRTGEQSQVAQTAVDRVFGSLARRGPAARLAADGAGTSATEYLGLIDLAISAAEITGPVGFALGSSLFFIKGLVGSGEGAGEAQNASAKLAEISDKLDALKKQLGDTVFDLQVGKTDDWITDVRETAKDLRTTLEHAKQADNKGLSEQQREDETTAFGTRKAEFIKGAEKLVNDRIAAKLNTALIDHQEAGDPQNPGSRLALLPQLRRNIAGERFLTAKKSAQIRDFFKYYSWWQVRLAAVLSEYYMLGGPCATATPPNTCDKPPKPDPRSAKKRVEEIAANIEKQRQVAGLPAKYLDEAPLDKKVFIDTKTGMMWGTNPGFVSSKDIVGYGTWSGCSSTEGFRPNCELQVTEHFAGYRGTPPQCAQDSTCWRAPQPAEAQGLFDDHHGIAVKWLEENADVSFDGYGGTARLKWRVALWLRNLWAVNLTHTQLSATMVALEDSLKSQQEGRGVKYKDPRTVHAVVGTHCNLDRRSCGQPDGTVGGFILWVRGTTAAERADYYVTRP
jgi:hypothetical protein